MQEQLTSPQPATNGNCLNRLIESLPNQWSVVHITNRDRWTWRVYNHNRELIAERDDIETALNCALEKKEPDDQRMVWDSVVPGLGVRANRKGSVWLLKYRCKNTQFFKKLGSTDELTEKKARALAKKIKQGAQKGFGPEPKAGKERVRISRMTIELFCDEYMHRYAKPRKKSWLKDQQRIEYYVLPVWRQRKLADIKHSDVARLHSDIGKKTPIAANRLLEVLNTMFRLAISWGYLPPDTVNPTKGIDPYPSVKKTRWLNDDELMRLNTVLDRTPIHKQAFFKMLLMTGCRSSEILHLRWNDVQLERGYINIDITKNGEPHRLPLSTKAIELLKALPQDGDKVFPGMRVDKAWQKIRREAKLEDVRIHDLRHTVASRLLQSGCTLRIVGEVLNHKSLTATNRYGHFTRENLRSPLEELASSMPIT